MKSIEEKEEDSMERPLEKIGATLKVTPEKIKELESTTRIPKYRHPLFIYKNNTRKIKNIGSCKNFLCAKDQSQISELQKKVDAYLKNQKEIENYQYFNTEFLIEDRNIYVVKINMLITYKNEDRNIIDVYSNIFNENNTLASWFTDKVAFGLGKVWQQYLSHPKKNDIYESQINFQIENGKIISQEMIDNTKIYERKIYIEE